MQAQPVRIDARERASEGGRRGVGGREGVRARRRLIADAREGTSGRARGVGGRGRREEQDVFAWTGIVHKRNTDS
jgi:hypothetical protein